MKIDVKEYEAKKYYSLIDINTGEELIELEKPREVLFDDSYYLALGEEDWKALKSKLGITKSDDEVTYEDVVGDYDGLSDLAEEMKVEGLLYSVDSDNPCFVDNIMKDAYIIFCQNFVDDEDYIIQVYNGEYLSSCYFGVCHQPFIKEFWSIGEGYEEVEYYELECVEDESTTWFDVETYVILEPDNKEKRVRVLRREHGRSQDSYWKNEVMSIEFFNEYHGFEFGYEGEEH